MKLKHGISVLLSAATLLSVSVGVGENSKLPSLFEKTAITAQASDYVWSGAYGTKFAMLVEEDVYLYFSYSDAAKSGAKIVGSGIGKADASIYIPDTVTFQGTEYKITEIADGAFEGQINLANVSGCRNIERIGNSSFKGCTELNYFSVYAFNSSGNWSIVNKVDNKKWRTK